MLLTGTCDTVYVPRYKNQLLSSFLCQAAVARSEFVLGSPQQNQSSWHPTKQGCCLPREMILGTKKLCHTCPSVPSGQAGVHHHMALVVPCLLPSQHEETFSQAEQRQEPSHSRGAIADALLPACAGSRVQPHLQLRSVPHAQWLPEDNAETLHKVHIKSMQANTDSTVMLDLVKKFLESLPHCLMSKCWINVLHPFSSKMCPQNHCQKSPHKPLQLFLLCHLPAL